MSGKKDLPPTYTLIKKGKIIVVLKEEYRETMLEMGIAKPGFFSTLPGEKSDRYYGRGALKTIVLVGKGNERIVIRHYHRGGKIQKLTSDLYWGASRPLRELWIGYQATIKGIPTAEILAVRHNQIFWRFHRGDLVTKEIENGKDLATYLRSLSQPLALEKILQKRKVIEVVGKLIRKMHDGGIFHGDLNLKNIVIQINDSQRIKGYILDFDKSFIKPNLSKNLRIRNLLRLNRSVEKFKAAGLPITRTDVLRFLISYYQDSTDFKKLLKDLNYRYKKHVYYHQLGKKILNLWSF